MTIRELYDEDGNIMSNAPEKLHSEKDSNDKTDKAEVDSENFFVRMLRIWKKRRDIEG